MTSEWCATMWLPRHHAAVPDPQHWHRAEVLAGHHPGGQVYLGGDQGALADHDPALAEDRTGRERRHRAAAERGELPPGRGPGYHSGPLRRLEGPVHRPPAQLAEAAHVLAEAVLAEAEAAEAVLAEAVLAEAEAASWPQAPSISRPRVSRTVTGTPCASAADELALRGGPRRGPLRPRRRVERDQVDVGEPPGQQRAQQVGPPGLVVDVPDQGVLDGDAAPGGRGVVPGGA